MKSDGTESKHLPVTNLFQTVITIIALWAVGEDDKEEEDYMSLGWMYILIRQLQQLEEDGWTDVCSMRNNFFVIIMMISLFLCPRGLLCS